jgi:hypothetical protein
MAQLAQWRYHAFYSHSWGEDSRHHTRVQAWEVVPGPGEEQLLRDGSEPFLVVPTGSELERNKKLADLNTWLNVQGQTSGGCLTWDLLAYKKETALGYKPDGVGYNDKMPLNSLMAHYAYFELKVGALAASAKGMMARN